MSDLSRDEIIEVLTNAKKMKADPHSYSQTLSGKTLLMLFEKASLRTRVSFETGMTQMGGHAIFYSVGDSPLGVKETFEDTGACLNRYVDCIMARLMKKEHLRALAKSATGSTPVINGLDNWGHPCQTLTDLLTIHEYVSLVPSIEAWRDVKMCYIGDCHNNVTYDIIRASAILGIDLRVCGPLDRGAEYAIERDFLDGNDTPKAFAQVHGDQNGESVDNVSFWTDPKEALDGVDVVYTDSWMSYGISKEDEARRVEAFGPYRVDDEKMRMAKDSAIFMNCLPAMRGHEQTASVIDGPQSVVFDQAENRLHAQKALLARLINGNFEP
jgi:ornithine carbamoyltransferase